MMSIKKTLFATSFLIASNASHAWTGDGIPEHRKVIEPTQYGYAQANAITTSSPMLYVSGQVGMSETEKNDFYSQVDRAFEGLANVLKKSGASAQDVVKITLLIVDFDPDKLAYMVKKRKSFFGNAYRARTLIPVTRLYTDGVKFEIDAIAILPN